jgi:hypothetical protein
MRMEQWTGGMFLHKMRLNLKVYHSTFGHLYLVTTQDVRCSVARWTEDDCRQLKLSFKVTELSIRPCLIFPALVSYCDPRTSPEDDALKGRWVRVERDLNEKTGRWYLNIWYRRSRRLDVPLITSLLILADDEMDLIPEPKESWHKSPGSLVDGVSSEKDLFLWYKLRPPLQDETEDQELEEIITEIDGWYFGIHIERTSGSSVVPYSSFRGRTPPLWI